MVALNLEGRAEMLRDMGGVSPGKVPQARPATGGMGGK
jgi:hypothetical protein